MVKHIPQILQDGRVVASIGMATQANTVEEMAKVILNYQSHPKFARKKDSLIAKYVKIGGDPKDLNLKDEVKAVEVEEPKVEEVEEPKVEKVKKDKTKKK